MFTILGALLSRLHGSDIFPYKVIKSLLWALPFGVFAGSFSNIYIGVFVLAVCASGKSTGHGRGISINNPILKGKPEKLEYLTIWLQPYVSVKLYKAIILSVSGYLSVLGFAVVMLWYDPVTALLATVLASLKPLGYLTGDTRIGELVSGMLAYAALDLLLFKIIL